MNTNKLIWNNIELGIKNFPKEYSSQKLFGYCSHIPLLKTICRILKKDNILECGPGFFSTSIFYNLFGKKFVAIEDNPKWYDILNKFFNKKDGFDIKLSNIFFDKYENPNKIHTDELTEEEKIIISNYYNKIKSEYKNIDILFIDQIKYARSIAIPIFEPICDIIVYHDAQSDEKFKYEVIKDIYNSKKCYIYTYRWWRYHTNILTKNPIKKNMIKDFIDSIKKEEKILINILLKYHPNLDFILTKESIFKKRKL